MLLVLTILSENAYGADPDSITTDLSTASNITSGSSFSPLASSGAVFYEDDGQLVESTVTMYVEETSPVAKTNVYVSTGVMVLIVLAICGIGHMQHWPYAALAICGIGHMRHWPYAALARLCI